MWTEQQYELAAKLAENEREAALAAVRGRINQASAGSVDGNCQDCGDDIGQARLAALPGASRCVSCQTVHEKKQSLFAR